MSWRTEDLRPLADAGVAGEPNRPLLAALAEHDLLPRLFPASLGGSREGDVSALDLCVLREGLAQRCTAAETALALQGLGAYPIVQSGTKELAARWIPEVAQGRAVAAFALTEPGAGSDAAALALEATAGWRRVAADWREEVDLERSASPTCTRCSLGHPTTPAHRESQPSSSRETARVSEASRSSSLLHIPSGR